jgi:hypothetical protein
LSVQAALDRCGETDLPSLAVSGGSKPRPPQVHDVIAAEDSDFIGTGSAWGASVVTNLIEHSKKRKKKKKKISLEETQVFTPVFSTR